MSGGHGSELGLYSHHVGEDLLVVVSQIWIFCATRISLPPKSFQCLLLILQALALAIQPLFRALDIESGRLAAVRASASPELRGQLLTWPLSPRSVFVASQPNPLLSVSFAKTECDKGPSPS